MSQQQTISYAEAWAREEAKREGLPDPAKAPVLSEKEKRRLLGGVDDGKKSPKPKAIEQGSVDMLNNRTGKGFTSPLMIQVASSLRRQVRSEKNESEPTWRGKEVTLDPVPYSIGKELGLYKLPRMRWVNS